jgi:hypothetical protein
MTDYLYVPFMSYGKKRRQFIKNLFLNNQQGQYCVNSKYRPQVKEDSDLKKLIKIGFLKQIRIKTSRTHGKTFLIYNGE